MDEDPNYSSLVFKNTTVTPKEQKDDQTIYSEVKLKKPVTTAAKEKEELNSHSVETPEEPAAADQNDDEEERKIFPKVKLEVSGTNAPEAETAAKRPTRVLLVCLGTLCVLLMVAVIVLLVQITMLMMSQGATIEELNAENQNRTAENKVLTNEKKQLMEAQRNLTNQTEELRKERNHLNRSLEVILTFDSFPVNTFCPNKKCQLCRVGWILFQEKCYLFYNESSWTAWKSWDDSRQFCQNNLADLVVINNLQEQQFVGNYTKFYDGIWHGFWLGLRNVSNSWVWVDGRNDTLGFWETSYYINDYVLLVPGAPPTTSWRREKLESVQKFICEREALIWST